MVFPLQVRRKEKRLAQVARQITLFFIDIQLAILGGYFKNLYVA